MFINEKTSCNVLRYVVNDVEKTDDFALRILKQGEIKGVFVPGVKEDEVEVQFLIPVSDSLLLEEYLREGTFEDEGGQLAVIADLLCQAIHISKCCKSHMLGDSVLLTNIKYAYVRDGQLRLICLPYPDASYETVSQRHFYKDIIMSGIYTSEEWKHVGVLVNYINSASFDEEEFLFYAEELSGKDVSPVEGDGDMEVEIEILQSSEKTIDKSGLLKRIGRFFFPEKQSDGMQEGEVRTMGSAPNGVHVLAVRSTGEEYPLCFGPDVIGTDENTCSICFPESKVIDQNHSKVYFENGKFYIEDLGSSVGTFVNNVKLVAGKPRNLISGDLIRVGGEELVFSKRIPI